MDLLKNLTTDMSEKRKNWLNLELTCFWIMKIG